MQYQKSGTNDGWEYVSYDEYAKATVAYDNDNSAYQTSLQMYSLLNGSSSFLYPLTLRFTSDNGDFSRTIKKTCRITLRFHTFPFCLSSSYKSLGALYVSTVEGKPYYTYFCEIKPGEAFTEGYSDKSSWYVSLEIEQTVFSNTESYAIENPADGTTFDPGEFSLIRYDDASSAETIIDDPPPEEPAPAAEPEP